MFRNVSRDFPGKQKGAMDIQTCLFPPAKEVGGLFFCKKDTFNLNLI